MSRDEFAAHPPVLLDIGAAGHVHRKWKDIARYSVCIALDADDRGMGHVTCEKTDEADFSLTRFPPCSSLLKPDKESLGAWAFSDFFKVERKVRLGMITLAKVLKETGSEIDWFKTDSQGTDLRLFDSL